MKKTFISSLFVFLAINVISAKTITYTNFNEIEYKSIESFYYIEEDSAITGTTKYRVVTKLMDYEVNSSGRQFVYVLTEWSDLYPLVHRGDQLPNWFGIDKDDVEVFIHVESDRFETIFVIDAIRLLEQQSGKNKAYYVERYQSPYDAKDNVRLLYSKDKDFKEGIEKGFIDVNYRYEYGETLLLELLQQYTYEPEVFIKIAEFLIKNGADPNIPDEDGMTPLLYAVTYMGYERDTKIIQFLLDNGADVNVVTNDGETILYELCSTSDADIELIKDFIARGAPINVSSEYSFTPLTYALYHDNVELAKLLIESGADVNLKDNDDNYPLNSACDTGDLGLVKLMLEKGADVTVTDEDNWTPLHYAVYSYSEENIDIVKLLVENGADVNARTKRGFTPLIYAGWDNGSYWEGGNGFEMIKYLVSQNADINAKDEDGYNVGMSSARLINLECCKFLAENGFDFTVCDDEGQNPFHHFIYAVTCTSNEDIFYYVPLLEREEEIAELISFYASKCDINAKTNDEETVLHIAASSYFDYTKILEFLIENGADVNAPDDYNYTPIFYCRSRPNMVQFLIDSGADVSVKNSYGKTCLDICEESVKYNPSLTDTIKILKANMKEEKVYSFVQLVEYNYSDEAMEMLRNGNPEGLDDYDSNGYTPLYYAVFNKNYDLVETLIEEGCDIDKTQGKYGSTVLYFAVDHRNLDMVKLLLKYQPDLSKHYRSEWYSEGDTVLSKAAYGDKSYELTKCLLEAGADPNAVLDNDSGLTVTADRCNEGDEKIAELLVEYGGNPFATWTSWIYWAGAEQTYSIVNKNIDYDNEQAVYRGLEKYFKDKIYVATDNLRIRDGSGLSSRTITAMKKGTRVKILEADDMQIIDDIHSCWVKIEVMPGSVDSEGKPLASGTTGWCFLGYLEPEK